jgi:hypothetical protein
MAIPPQVRTKFYVLRALALILILLAAAIFMLRPHNLESRSLAILAIFGCLWLVKRSNMVVWRARGDVVAEWSSNKSGRVGRSAWIFTTVSLLACVVSYFLMYLDQLHGGNDVWPVYLFAVAGLAPAVAVGNVTMRIYR